MARPGSPPLCAMGVPAPVAARGSRTASGGTLSAAGRASLGQSGASASLAAAPSTAPSTAKTVAVELRGHQKAFDLGGKFGHVVTQSHLHTVHKGWRVVAVDGKSLQPLQVGQALREARQRSRYSVSFSTGDVLVAEREEASADAPSTSLALAGDAERSLREAAEAAAAEAAAAEAERQLQERLAAERKAAEQKEADRKAGEQREAERKAAEQREQEEEEARARQKEEELKVQRGAAEERLAKNTGLPPRDKVAEPQMALLEALMCKLPEPPKKKEGPCDKCDGPHHADDCPHFKKSREQHHDATEKYGGGKVADAGGSGGPFILKSGRIVPQPGDGSCLFHSLAYGLKSVNAEDLREKVADYIAQNPNAQIGGNPLKDWVLWDSGTDVKSYAATMRTGSRWGGAVELAVCARIHQVPVHVYTRSSKGFERISTFGDDGGDGGTVINVHYGGRVHYDALEA